MDVRALLGAKRDGGRLSEAQTREFIAGYVSGEVPDHVASALLMAIFLRGMDAEELEHWTRAMLESGRVMRFEGSARPRVDKHSTGGVGDKASIPLAPAVAACGAAVPMISGRGLGHTGGTLDKLEAIPGLRTDLSEQRFAEVLERCGLAFGAQTDDLVPADKKLYALRDVTGLVASIPLIASSILSKKLAEGLDALVLDVKYGSGAFLPEPERGAELARTMLALAARFGLRASAFRTSMAQPLGRAVGHALEIRESIECLSGGGPDDLASLVVCLGGEMLHLGGLAESAAQGEHALRESLASGRALERFAQVVAAQGGDPRVVERPELLPSAPDVLLLAADREGALCFEGVAAVGRAVLELGGGRRALGDAIDPGVGLVWLAKQGDPLRAGDPICELHHRGGRGLERARALLAGATSIGEPVVAPPLVLDRLEG